MLLVFADCEGARASVRLSVVAPASSGFVSLLDCPRDWPCVPLSSAFIAEVGLLVVEAVCFCVGSAEQ